MTENFYDFNFRFLKIFGYFFSLWRGWDTNIFTEKTCRLLYYNCNSFVSINIKKIMWSKLKQPEWKTGGIKFFSFLDIAYMVWNDWNIICFLIKSIPIFIPVVLSWINSLKYLEISKILFLSTLFTEISPLPNQKEVKDRLF